MATQAQQAAELRAAVAQMNKSREEIVAVQAATDVLKQKVIDLEAQLAAGVEATPELVQAVADVKAAAQVVDDLIPDTAPPAEPTA